MRFSGMSRIPVQGDTHRLLGIPVPHPTQELADVLRPFARIKSPTRPTVVYFIKSEQVKTPSGLLITGQHQVSLPGIPSSPIGLDGDGLDIEKEENAAARAMSPLAAEASQDGGSLGIIPKQFAADPAQVEPPFFSTRRRCSRLMPGMRRCCKR